MEDIAIRDFEQFCDNNDVKPTNMKADYYLAGHFKGQERMSEKACEWLKEHLGTDLLLVNHDMIEEFKKAMGDEE